MQVYPADTLRLDASVVTIGAFDGVHLGHQALLRRARERAWSLDVPLVIYTFDPPPKVFFGRAELLTPLEEKLRRLSLFAPDFVVVASFNATYARRKAIDFIRELFQLGAREVWTGQDFHFGHQREGNCALLERYFRVQSIDKVCCSQAQRISSTRIRQLISRQQWEEASRLMGWRVTPQSTSETKYSLHNA